MGTPKLSMKVLAERQAQSDAVLNAIALKLGLTEGTGAQVTEPVQVLPTIPDWIKTNAKGGYSLYLAGQSRPVLMWPEQLDELLDKVQELKKAHAACIKAGTAKYKN